MPTAKEVAEAVWSFPVTSGTAKYSSNGSQIDAVVAARNLNEHSVPDLSAKVDQILELLAHGGSGGGLSADEVRAIVRDELNKTKLTS